LGQPHPEPARLTGPITRDAFIWAEFSEIAPGRSSRPTQGRDDGDIGRAVHGIADADEEDHHYQEDVRRRGCSHDPGQAQREDELLDRQQDQKLLAVDLVGDEAPNRGQEQGRSELGEYDNSDEVLECEMS
jgi:hypothetical protein